jgi:PTS system arbutin-like IIC component
METATMFYIGKFLILRFKMRTPGQEQQGRGLTNRQA